MRKFYSKETGWTEYGIKEQERRSDLTKLTAEGLLLDAARAALEEKHSQDCMDAWYQRGNGCICGKEKK